MTRKNPPRLPALPLFIDDFEAATVHLSLAEDGAYNRLMRLIWRTPGCSVPNDPEWLRRRLRATKDEYETIIEPVIKEFFYVKKNRIFQKRLLKEFDYVSAKKTSGKAGGDANALNYNNKMSRSASGLLGSEIEATGEAKGKQLGKPQPNPTHRESGTEDIDNNIRAHTPTREGQKSYAFEGEIAKVNQKDFDKWAEVYCNIIDLKSELQAIDDWCVTNWVGKDIGKRKKWFHAVSSMLRTKHQKAPPRKAASSSVDPYDPDNKWRNRVRHWIQFNEAADNWFNDDGPRPDEVGHHVPPHIMKEFDLADPNIDA